MTKPDPMHMAEPGLFALDFAIALHRNQDLRLPLLFELLRG